MAELDFSDLIPKAPSSQGLSFDDLIPSSVPAAIADIPKEASSAFGQSVQHLTGNSVSDLPGYDPRTRGELGPVEGLMRTGRQIAALPEMVASPFVGAARSLIGHPMAQAEHAVGTVIAPEIAAKDDPQKMYEAAKGDVDTALAGARPAGAPVKVGGVRAWQAPPSEPVKAAPPSIQELKTAASADYQSPEVRSLAVKPTVIRNFADAAHTALTNEGFDSSVAERTFGLLERLKKAPDGSVITGDNINNLRKLFGKVAESTERSERKAASMAIEWLDEALPKIPQSEVLSGDLGAASAKLQNARDNFSAAAQAEKIDKKVVQAEIRAAAANSGQNVSNTIRQRMADVVLNPKDARGLLPEELAAAKKISEGTRTQNAIRIAGNILGGGGGLGTVAASVAGGLATGGIGSALPLVGFALRAVGNRMTLTQAAKLSEAIRSRAPLASSAQKFEEAAAALQAKRNPRSIAGLILASRNLSTNLKGAGFDISPTDLFKGLQSGNAEDQQKDVQRPP